RWLSTRSCRSTPACTSISAIRRARGSAAPTRTPAGCFDSTSRKAQTSPATAPKIWPQSQPRSTVGRARPSAGAPPPRASTSTWAPRHEPPQQTAHAAIAAPARPPGGPPQRQPRQSLQSHPNHTLLRGPVEFGQCIDHRDSDRDLLTRSVRDPNTLEPCSPLAGEQIQLTAVWQPVVIEHRTDPLLPLTALVDQRVTQPDRRAQIKQMIGRDPRLRQPPDHQQLAQMLRVSTVALRTLLVAAQRARLR